MCYDVHLEQLKEKFRSISRPRMVAELVVGTRESP